MSYHKMTSISGYKQDGSYYITIRPGHWKPSSIERLVAKSGLVRDISADHSTADMSGKGRGGYDRRFAWQGGKIVPAPLAPYMRDFNEGGDADDVNSAYDD